VGCLKYDSVDTGFLVNMDTVHDNYFSKSL